MFNFHSLISTTMFTNQTDIFTYYLFLGLKQFLVLGSLTVPNIFPRTLKHYLTLYSIITPFKPLKYHIFENIMENRAFAL